jgi:deoxyribonuclease-4
MGERLLGAHMPTGKGLGDALRRGKEIGCTAVQVFTSSPQQWKARAVTQEMVADFRDAQAETGIRSVISHDSYLVNLCAPSDDIRVKSLAALKSELGRCAAYGIPWAVSHVGAAMGQPEEVALRRAAEGLCEVLDASPPGTGVLMETTAGQGSTLNHRFETLAWLLNALRGDSRVGVCFDTAHVFAAGYDLRTPEAFAATIEEFDRIVGLDRLHAIHCNDSKKGLGSRVDRHAHLGEGELGEGAFRALLDDPRLAGLPVLLETPEAETMHAVNLARLWSWA